MCLARLTLRPIYSEKESYYAFGRRLGEHCSQSGLVTNRISISQVVILLADKLLGLHLTEQWGTKCLLHLRDGPYFSGCTASAKRRVCRPSECLQIIVTVYIGMNHEKHHHHNLHGLRQARFVLSSWRVYTYWSLLPNAYIFIIDDFLALVFNTM
jgi:hypothetical protein